MPRVWELDARRLDHLAVFPSSTMSWGTELWDQYDNLSLHTQKGIDFLERYGHFIRDRCKIETEYAANLSPCRAFKLELNEVNDQAGQREVIAENLTANVLKELNILVKDFKEDRKKYLQEGARLMSTLTAQIQSLERARKAYEKAFREAERALENYQRADADLNLSRAEVEKQRMNMTLKTQQKRAVAPIISQCLEGIEKAANEVNEKEDTLLVIERFKSGFQPPGDFPFEDLSVAKSYDSNTQLSQTATMQPIHNHLTVKGTVSGGKIKKRVGIFGIFSSNKNNVPGYGDGAKEDCSDLPPNQRKKRLQQRLDEIQAKIAQETAARDALMKMKGVYEQNPALGDPMSIEGQLNQSGQKLDKLGTELIKFQGYLDDAIKTGVGLSSHSGGEESLSRSASDSSVGNAHAQAHKHTTSPSTPQPTHDSTNSPESGLGASRTSLPGSNAEEYDVDELDAQPPLGTCRALYPFDGTSEGSIPMYDGEELYMIELDQGDGWTRVRRMSNPVEGFVPTSYIEYQLFDT
ncbi:Similar to fnbp1l: Formin-binding protein 1-like (Xenopus laevis) [Cotesia congregata]|uniref:Similar to fnbp1l: Formin-binding protein 1-like (Xenopus laevis) n=1 Tax=Cotesia congregata TaxID=51543 RepID=A0A8J2H6M3_COTCN|nr:Similar to fnbp1l: Formin-binding protein 1-like (Xenopus laevis) [Cotesia congregata]